MSLATNTCFACVYCFVRERTHTVWYSREAKRTVLVSRMLTVPSPLVREARRQRGSTSGQEGSPSSGSGLDLYDGSFGGTQSLSFGQMAVSSK